MKHTLLVFCLGCLILAPAMGMPQAVAATKTDGTPAKANNDPAYSQLRTARLSGETVAVQNLVLRRGTATITFANGVFHFLGPVEDRVTAAVFIGAGEFSLTPTRIPEQHFLRFLTDSNNLTDKFTKMVVRFTDGSYNEIKQAAASKAGAPDSSAQGTLDDHRKLLRKGRINTGGMLKYNLDLRILQDLLGSTPGGLFCAFFDGDRYGDLIFTLDPLGAPAIAPEEISLTSISDRTLGIWVGEHLPEHYRQGDAGRENHQLVDMQHFQIVATTRKDHLEAKVTSRFTALTDGYRVIPFNLFSKLRVSKVTDAAGSELSFIQEDKDEDADFAVILPAPIKKGQEYSLNFEYAGDEALSDEGGGNFTLVMRDNWYPNGPFGDRATYDMTLKVPKGLTMVATAQPAGESTEGELSVTRWKSDLPIAVAGFNYGNFKKSAVKDDKIKTTFEAYANKYIPDFIQGFIRQAEQAESREGQNSTEMNLGNLNTVQLMDKARTEAQFASEIYTDMYGPAPFGRLAITQQPAPNFGQAWPMLIYMPLTAFFDSTQRQNMGMGGATDFFKEVAAHETAHQWWGHVVGWQSYRDQWMSEGGAQVSASLFVQTVYKNKKFIEFWQDLRRLTLEKNQMGKSTAEIGDVTLGYRGSSPKIGDTSYGLLYTKAAFVFHMLRMMMWNPKTGDVQFQALMKDFFTTFANQNATTDDFKHMVEKHITPDLDLDGNGKMDWFFNEWVTGSLIPDYKLDYQLSPAENGKTRLSFKITQSKVDDKFAMRVPVYLDFDGNYSRLGTVNLFGNSTSEEISVNLAKKPKRVVLCAFEDVLCTTDAR